MKIVRYARALGESGMTSGDLGEAIRSSRDDDDLSSSHSRLLASK